MDVMFYEVFQEEETALRKFLPDNIDAQFTCNTVQENDAEDPPAQLISIRTQSRIPDHWMKCINGVLTRSQGFDHLIDLQEKHGESISFGYLGNYCERAVAEQAIMTTMALLRKFKEQLSNFDTFHRDGLTGLECRGRNIFVVGVGHIGSEIVDIARGMRMNVKGFDIEQRIKDLSYVSLDEGLMWADIAICALPLTKETNKMLSYEVLQKAKPGLFFINIARGEISPEEDLKTLLSEGILAGVSMDVYSQEDQLAHSLRNGRESESDVEKAIGELSTKEQVLLTPHNAFNTQEALAKKASLTVESVVHHIEHGSFPHPVVSA